MWNIISLNTHFHLSLNDEFSREKVWGQEIDHSSLLLSYHSFSLSQLQTIIIQFVGMALFFCWCLIWFVLPAPRIACGRCLSKMIGHQQLFLCWKYRCMSSCPARARQSPKPSSERLQKRLRKEPTRGWLDLFFGNRSRETADSSHEYPCFVSFQTMKCHFLVLE